MTVAGTYSTIKLIIEAYAGGEIGKCEQLSKFLFDLMITNTALKGVRSRVLIIPTHHSWKVNPRL